MPHFHIPLPASQAYLEGLVQGFFLEANELGEIALLIKAEPSVMDRHPSWLPVGTVLGQPEYSAANDHVVCQRFANEAVLPAAPSFWSGRSFCQRFRSNGDPAGAYADNQARGV